MLPNFSIRRPETVEQACDLLVEYEGEAALYAGGTELVLAMKLGFADYPLLVDVKPLSELGAITMRDGSLRIGAAVTHRQIEDSPVVAGALPSLVALERRVANPRVRAIGTIGGNLAFGEPHSDPATYLVAVGAEIVCRSAGGGSRTIAAADFLTGPFETALGPEEILVEVRIPLPTDDVAITHQRFVLTERPAATATSAIGVVDGVVTSARIAVGAASPVPARLPLVEELLVGREVEELLAGAGGRDTPLRRAGAAAGQTVTLEPGDDAYLRQLVSVLVQRGVCEALRMPSPPARATGSGPAR